MMSSAATRGVVVWIGGKAAKVVALETGKARSPAPTIDTATTVHPVTARYSKNQIQLSGNVMANRIDADHLDHTGRHSDSWHGSTALSLPQPPDWLIPARPGVEARGARYRAARAHHGSCAASAIMVCVTVPWSHGPMVPHGSDAHGRRQACAPAVENRGAGRPDAAR